MLSDVPALSAKDALLFSHCGRLHSTYEKASARISFVSTSSKQYSSLFLPSYLTHLQKNTPKVLDTRTPRCIEAHEYQRLFHKPGEDVAPQQRIPKGGPREVYALY